MVPGRGTITGRAVIEGRTIHIPDVLADPEYSFREGQKDWPDTAPCLASRCCANAPPSASWPWLASRPRPFTDKQIELATTFADQAVIAIENVRLFESVEARTRELAQVAGGSADRAGPPDPDGEARLARPADRRHRARDQEPAQLRQQLLRALGRADR